MNKKIIDIILSILGILFGIYICVGTKNSVVGIESIFPYLIGGGVILTSIILLLVTLKENNNEKLKDKNYKVVGIMIISLIVYSIAIEYAGYLISTFILCALILFMLSEKVNLKRTVIVSLGTTIIVYSLFSFVLKVPLPSIF
ncbi:MAG: tripartite tricarboxylate transporter TctB family protein [Fusobacterium sp. JB019]|nr:tripartite tricarboxylate transporter TctB family protein [Fusobacterium sp. JB019]